MKKNRKYSERKVRGSNSREEWKQRSRVEKKREDQEKVEETNEVGTKGRKEKNTQKSFSSELIRKRRFAAPFLTNVDKRLECKTRDASHDPVKLPSQFRDTDRTTACINASRHRDALSEIIYGAKL